MLQHPHRQTALEFEMWETTAPGFNIPIAIPVMQQTYKSIIERSMEFCA